MPKGPRSSYTATFKLEVVAHAESTNNRVAGRKFGVNESVVRRWRKLKTQYEDLDDKHSRKCLKKRSRLPEERKSCSILDTVSLVEAIAYDTLPDEVVVKIEWNPSASSDGDQSAFNESLLGLGTHQVNPLLLPVELSDMVSCSRHMDGNLSLLASAMDVTDKDMENLQSNYKSTSSQALQLLKIWHREGGGSKQELSKLLCSAGFAEAAERQFIYCLV